MAKYKLQKYENGNLTDLDLDAKTLDGNGTSGFVGNVSITENSAIGDQITITKVDGTTNNITIKNAYHSTSSDFAGESQYSDKSGDSDQLGGKNASEYLTGITKDQVTTALGYTPLQTETKSYQHNITVSYSDGYLRLNFIDNQSTSYTNLSGITTAIQTKFGAKPIMAIGQHNKEKIWLGTFVAKQGELGVSGIDFKGSNAQYYITSATSITDIVVEI